MSMTSKIFRRAVPLLKDQAPQLQKELYFHSVKRPLGEGDIEMMTNKATLRKNSKATNYVDPLKPRTCPWKSLAASCEGTGEKVDGREKRVRRIRRQEAKWKPSCGVRIVHQIGRKRRRRPRKKKIRGGTRDDAGKTSKPLERDFSFFKDEGDAGGSVLNPAFETRSTYVVPVGRHRLQHNLRQLTADSSSSTEADGELGAESARSKPLHQGH